MRVMHGTRATATAGLWLVLAGFMMLGAPALAESQKDAAKDAKDAVKEAKDSKESKESSEKPAASREGKRAASELADIINNLDYPELMVVPRASERLKLEAKDEESNFLFTHWAFELSGLATAGVGAMATGMQRTDLTTQEKADFKSVQTITQAVGVGWVVAGLAMGIAKPYESGLSRISKLNGKDERTLLLRERLAEESLEKPARFIRPLITASIVTNLGMSAVMGSYMTEQGRLMAGASVILAFLPAIFDDPSIVVYEKHLEYKKKIYGPVGSSGLGYDPASKTYFPTTALTWRF